MAESRVYPVAPFNAVSITTGLRAIITHDSIHSVRVEVEQNRLFSKIDIKVVDGKLCATRHTSLFEVIAAMGLFFPARVKRDITVHIMLPELAGIEAFSSAEAAVDSVSGAVVEVAASTGASVEIGSAKAEIIRLRTASNGEISIAGACDLLDVRVSSGSRVSTIEMSATNVVLNGSNGAFAEVTALGSVTGAISNGVVVHLYGRPRSVDVKTSKSARLTVN